MKQIKSIQIWTSQGTKTAEYFDARIIADDLETSATFYWNMNAKSDDAENPIGQQLIDGNISMSGEDYDAWSGSNEAAYSFVANAIGIEIV